MLQYALILREPTSLLSHTCQLESLLSDFGEGPGELVPYPQEFEEEMLKKRNRFCIREL